MTGKLAKERAKAYRALRNKNRAVERETELRNRLKLVSAQRDGLLVALKKAVSALESCTTGDSTTGHVIYPSFDESLVADAYCEARSVIANVKGSAT